MKQLIIFCLLSILLSNNFVQAQCRSFTKRKCRPNLEDYTHDGKMNTAQLFAGDRAEIKLTFYKDQSYRLLVCADNTFENTEFTIYDTDKNKIYESKNKESDFKDFKVAATQQLIVEIFIPEEGNESDNEFEMTGCVSVLVGVK